MIGIIGVKRIFVFFVFISLNMAFGAALYLHIIPENIKSEREIRGLRSQLSSVKRDIDRMQIEFEQLDKQQDRFDDLTAGGFFSTQVRSDAKTLFSNIQKESKVISAVVSVKSGVILDNDEAKKVNHNVLLSPVEIEIKAFDDASIYKYIDISLRKFPGHLSIDNVIIKRSRDINAPILRAISSGANPELVNAKIKMSWRTVIPASQVITDKKH